jgi:hypothetical protein
MSMKTLSAFRSFSTNILSALSADLTAPSALESAPLRQESPPHFPQPAPPHSSSQAWFVLVVPSQTWLVNQNHNLFCSLSKEVFLIINI